MKKRMVEAEKNVPSFCISLSESAIRVAGTSGKVKVEEMILVIFLTGFDGEELRWNADVAECLGAQFARQERKQFRKESFRKSEFETREKVNCLQ